MQTEPLSSPDLPPVPRRDPGVVMRLARMGSAHPTRLSFLRILLRRMTGGAWRFDRPLWTVDAKGVGRAVYRATGPDRTYCLVAFAHDLPDEMRSDRVIATAWDATFALFDGMPTEADLDRLEANVPLQEAGRVSGRELTLSRANRSVRLFAHVVDRLAKGQQPDRAEVEAVGYLMRTTAVYGSGKFGAADRRDLSGRPELAEPFQAEMLTVWLIRQFTTDLVEHLARVKGGAAAVPMEASLKRGLGVGNSTGLGMAPFLVRHPMLLDHWMVVREEALSRVRRLDDAPATAISALRHAHAEAILNAEKWHSDHPLQQAKLAELRKDLLAIGAELDQFPAMDERPWDALWLWGEANLSLEGQEALVSLMLEPHGDLVDGLATCMTADEQATFRLRGDMTLGEVQGILQSRYHWALKIDFTDPAQSARFWYVSEEKLEPRLGDRSSEAGADREQPLCIARLAQEMDRALSDWPETTTVAEFLVANPEHRLMMRRLQIAARYPYAEVQDNLIAADMLPIDLMRCKLAFFGASRFDPRSDKWVRISLFQDCPYPLDLGA